MKIICTLNVSNINCPFLTAERECQQKEQPNGCSFRKELNSATPSKPVRQEKWFEKFYK